MKKIKFKIYSDGSQHWYLNGKRHRDDGLAVIYLDGSRYWYLDGEFIKDNRDEKD